MRKRKVRLLVDSGAFSVWEAAIGTKIDPVANQEYLEEYAAWAIKFYVRSSKMRLLRLFLYLLTVFPV